MEKFYFYHMYISITGLKPKGFLSIFRFWRLAVPSFMQAKSAKGNLSAEVKKMHGFQCTVTAWENREFMLEFMRSGVHLKAMKAFPKIATGKSHGYEAESIPSWDEAFETLLQKGRDH